MSQALLRDAMNPCLTTGCRGLIGEILTFKQDGLRRYPRVFARKRCDQCLLSIARNAGNPKNFAGANTESDLTERDPVDFPGRERQTANGECFRSRRSDARRGSRWFCADHQSGEAGVGFAPRIDFARHAPAALDRALVAESPDFVEFVAHVEDGTAPAGQLAQRAGQQAHGRQARLRSARRARRANTAR